MEELSLISKLLQQLLSTYNRVSLPGVGAFKAEYMPATFINDGKGMRPPSKQIYFSSAEIWNDNLLEDALSKEKGCNFEDAKQQLADFGEQALQTLTAGQRIVFPGLGALRMTEDQEYCFEAENNQQLNSDTFGLLDIEMTPIQPIVVEPPIVQFQPPPSPVTIKHKPFQAPKKPLITKKQIQILAIVIAVVILGFLCRKPIRTIIERIYYGEYYSVLLEERKNNSTSNP